MSFNTNDAPLSNHARNAHDLATLQEKGLMPELQSALIFSLGKQHFTPAIPTIEEFLTDADPNVRAEALKALIRYFKIERHWETARRFLASDPSEIPQIMGAVLLGELRRDTGDPRTLAILARVANDEAVDPLVRGNAYAAMSMVRQYDAQAYGALVAKNIDEIPDVDWAWVTQCSKNDSGT